MAQLPSRTIDDTSLEHLDDHDEIHDQLNDLDPDAASDGDILKMSTGAWSPDTAANHGISEVGHTHSYAADPHTHTEAQISDLAHFVETEVTDVSGTYQVLVTDRVVRVDTSAAPGTAVLPSVDTFGDYAIMFKRKGATYPLAIQRSVSDQFWMDGNTSNSLTIQDNGGQVVLLGNTADNQWDVVGERGTVT